jgi:hypothetical protein
MKIVLGALAFDNPGGTETYVMTVAHELRRLGHEPVVATEEPGAMAELAERRGIFVASDPSMLPSSCDAVFAQDAVMAGTLAERYPDTRMVAFAHSTIFDHQLPHHLPGVVSAVVVASDRFATRVKALALDVPIVRLRHPIDMKEFAPRGPIRERPRRALILSNYLDGARRRAVTDPWEAAGVECVQVGVPTTPELDVATAIADADIVVGKARAALEGMSCARAVYVFDEFGGDGWVTPQNYASFEADNFAGQATPTVRDPARDLADYRSDMGWKNRDLIRNQHGAHNHAVELVEVLRGTGPRSPDHATAAGEIARLTRALWDAERRTLGLEHEAARLREQMITAEATLESEKAEMEQRAIDAERQAAELRRLLDTRRAQVGLAAGRVFDRLRVWR